LDVARIETAGAAAGLTAAGLAAAGLDAGALGIVADQAGIAADMTMPAAAARMAPTRKTLKTGTSIWGKAPRSDREGSRMESAIMPGMRE
jgi:hypothetical protein